MFALHLASCGYKCILTQHGQIETEPSKGTQIPSDGHFYVSKPSSSQEKNNPNPFLKKEKFGLYQYGGANGIRTRDLYNANVAR